MKQENFNTTPAFPEKPLPVTGLGPRKPRILVAPLDWGLGHATRCIPVIYELFAQGCDVAIASDGPQAAVLKQEFPSLNFLELPGYQVKYGKSSNSTIWNILFQTPKILRAIEREHRWLAETVKLHQFDAVISDNRYGLYHPAIHSIIITHQLNIKTHFGKWTEKILQKRNYKLLDQFNECWIPDNSDANNLSGELSHPDKMPKIKTSYIGTLSRFDATHEQVKSGQLLILLSGPEPQRTILENKIVKDIAHYNGSATIVRGLPDSKTLIPSTNTIRFYNHLPTADLNKEMTQAEYVICRSGYSSIMDIHALQKKSILIPTPGQTEQEYLASYLYQKGFAFTLSQKSFSLFSALEQAATFDYRLQGNSSQNLLAGTISKFIEDFNKE